MGTITASPPQSAAPRLTSADRCDRCTAAAQVRVELTSGGSLLFCGHHFGAHENALRTGRIVARVQDERSSIA